MTALLLRLEIRYEEDIVAARQRARQIAALFNFETFEQTRIAAAASEAARNALSLAGGGTVEFAVDEDERDLLIAVADQGPRAEEAQIPAPVGADEPLSGMEAARRLVDRFEIETDAGARTRITLHKSLPRSLGPITDEYINTAAQNLLNTRVESPLDELQRQNRELLRTMDELKRVNNELNETNRGVVALYAELEDKAERLRRADEVKTRFFSNMSHEFRTPVISAINLARLLLDETGDGLSGEQQKQVQFIKKAMENLLELISDLLDLRKVEAGKTTLTLGSVNLSDIFATLRGMFRPLLATQYVSLVIAEPGDIPPLYTDEGKLAQILRNFLSNAVKFTERGEIRVWAEPIDGKIRINVADTGIGIAREDQARIFEEYTQAAQPRVKKAKGTGLGLPLARKLAELLGGEVGVESEPGRGSTFHVVVPRRLQEEPTKEVEIRKRKEIKLDDRRHPVLIVEDRPETIYTYRKYLEESSFQVLPAQSVAEAREILQTVRPSAVVLDILLPGADGWSLLTELKSNPKTADIPIIVATVIDEQQRGFALGADDYLVKPFDEARLLDRLLTLNRGDEVLIVDDDEADRYLLNQALEDTGYRVREAADADEGLAAARADRPAVIILDLMLPRKSGFEALKELQNDSRLRAIPVIVCTGKSLSAEERELLHQYTQDIISKDMMSGAELADYVRAALSRTLLEVPEALGG
jgi:signal transduction histidine kinase/CheY-like chemotaxis protein